jgi:hypothetical protein
LRVPVDTGRRSELSITSSSVGSELSSAGTGSEEKEAENPDVLDIE